MPYFSIIMPAYNRQREIRRAIQSCLDQDYTDFEIVVTDDGSMDDTAAVVEEFAQKDPRVRLLRHERNRCVCPARNTAAAAAQGEWMITLDSDQSLRPGALTAMSNLTASMPNDVGQIAAPIAWDTGIVTPVPIHPGGTFQYEEYVAWWNSLENAECFNCIRRQVWTGGIHWPDNRASEGGFHLNIAARWRIHFHPDIFAVYHTDAPNRCCQTKDYRRAKENLGGRAWDHAIDASETLHVHGKVLARYAPRLFQSMCYVASLNWFLAGDRLKGLKYWIKCLKARPFAPKTWFIAAFGMIGPRMLLNSYSCIRYLIPKYLKRLHGREGT